MVLNRQCASWIRSARGGMPCGRGTVVGVPPSARTHTHARLPTTLRGRSSLPLHQDVVVTPSSASKGGTSAPHSIDERTTDALLRELELECEGELQRRVTRLLCLLPDLQPRLSRLPPPLLASLLLDTRRAGYRLLELKSMFPSANVGSMVARYPNLLLSPDWENVQRHRATLLQMLPPRADVNRVVESVPLVLMLDLEQVGADLRRLIPGCDPGEVLAKNPGIVLNVMNISHLSIW